jgi:hypothetical protein
VEQPLPQITLPLEFAQETDSQFLHHFIICRIEQKKRKNQTIIFSVFYEIDEHEVERDLSLNYHKAQRMLITSIGL